LEISSLNNRIGAHTCTNQTVPYGTVLLGDVSRHFVPGYDQAIPPGQKTIRASKLPPNP
jgi:hypothetical protein